MTGMVFKFKLRDDTPAGEAGAALKQICGMQDVFNVAAAGPQDAGSPSLVYTAEVRPAAAAQATLKAVKDVPYVERAYVTL